MDARPQTDEIAVSGRLGRRRGSIAARATSILIVLATIVVVAAALRDGIATSDRDRTAPAISVGGGASVSVRAVGFGDPEGMVASTLSLAAGETRSADRFAIAAGLPVPETPPYVLALRRANGHLAGLAWVDGEGLETDGENTISPLTTARALVALAPGILNRDPTITRGRLTSVIDSTEFEVLVAEITASEDLLSNNPRLESALAAVLNRVAGEPVKAEAGCDSALGSTTTIAAGTCIVEQPGTDAVEILNGQDRWVMLYPSEGSTPCALVPPRPSTRIVSFTGECPPVVELTSPGALDPDSSELTAQRMLVAAALTAFDEYALAFADHALGSSGAASEATRSALADHTDFVGQAFGRLVEDNPVARVAAGTFADADAPGAERTLALLTLSRMAIAAPEIPQRLITRSESFTPSSVGASLLALYDRTHTWRSGGASPPTWSAGAATRVDLSALLGDGP